MINNLNPDWDYSLRVKKEQERLEQLLLDAVSEGDLTKVKQAIECGADVDGIDDWMNPLVRAVTTSQMEIIEYLLQHGADINIKSEWLAGGRPLHKAATCGNYAELIPLLLKYSADVNAEDDAGGNPFAEFIKITDNWDDPDFIKTAQLFIDASLDMSKRFYNEQYSYVELMMAIAKYNNLMAPPTEIIELLKQHEEKQKANE